MVNNKPLLRFNGFYGDWDFKKLGDVANITIGEFVIKTLQSPLSKYPVYNGGTSFTGFYDKYNNDGEKVVISARGSAGFINFVKSKYWAGNSSYSINYFDNDIYSINFLYFYLKKSESSFIKLLQSSNIPSISKMDVQNRIIPVPSFSEQTKIGKFFRNIDTLIENEENKYNKLLDIKKSLLNKMFPIENMRRTPKLGLFILFHICGMFSVINRRHSF